MNGVPVTRMEYSEDSRVLLVEYDPGDGTRQRLEFTGWLLISPTTPTRKGNNLHWDLGLKVTPDHTTGVWGRLTIIPPPDRFDPGITDMGAG